MSVQYDLSVYRFFTVPGDRVAAFHEYSQPGAFQHLNLSVLTMNKRILVLDKSAQSAPTDKNVQICSDPGEALSVLMGGSSTYTAEAGKIRPDVLVMEATFLDTYEGVELLEIMRKYYTLRNISILIATDEPAKLDPAIGRRYQIAGTIPKPYMFGSFGSILGENSDVASGIPGTGSSLAGVIAAPHQVLVDVMCKLANVRHSLHSVWKILIGSKAVVATSAAVVTLAIAGATYVDSIEPANRPTLVVENKTIPTVAADIPTAEPETMSPPSKRIVARRIKTAPEAPVATVDLPMNIETAAQTIHSRDLKIVAVPDSAWTE
jgi:hypothetical protein